MTIKPRLQRQACRRQAPAWRHNNVSLSQSWTEGEGRSSKGVPISFASAKSSSTNPIHRLRTPLNSLNHQASKDQLFLTFPSRNIDIPRTQISFYLSPIQLSHAITSSAKGINTCTNHSVLCTERGSKHLISVGLRRTAVMRLDIGAEIQ